MKHSKRFLCLLLTLILAASLCVFPAAATDQTCPSSKDDPVVFVHGLMGWGQRAGINAVLPYWGMTTGSLTSYLNSLGYETYSATVGPISSAWDRACELYAQLTGTTVDYGAAHAAAHDHARYGITYDQPLFSGWGTKHAVNLVGHSFGGATTRQFLELMANGSAEEVAAAKAAGTAPSPLFTGGKSSWVHSMTEIAAPHNGTTFIESNGTIMDVATNLAETLAKGFGITEIKNLYDFQLEQFGIYKDPNETVLETLQRVFSTDFMSHNDNAFLDLTIDKSLEINDGIGIEPNVYYFSYAGNQTVQDPVSGNYIPSAKMWTLFYPGAYNMGKYYDKYTAGGFYIDKSWRPNDGMVNTVSAFYPIHSDGTCLTKDGKQGWTNYDGYSNINFQPGIWYVMPVQSFDHIQFVGGMLNGSLVKTHALYRGVMEDIYSTYTAEPTGTAFPFTDVPASRWSYPYIKELYEAGVVSGTTATTFEPTGNVTRAQFVTMLALLPAWTCPLTSTAHSPTCRATPGTRPTSTGRPPTASSAARAPRPSTRTRRSRGRIWPSCSTATRSGTASRSTEQTAAPFTDEGSIAAYALPAVQALHSAGVISGMPDGSFRPYATATREQACTVLCML
ncbi:MAG: S-layer homology domain-containing protein [Oscillospiraceae bacterium]